MNHEFIGINPFFLILVEDRYVRLVRISNVGDLLLGPADSSYELPYFWILVPEYQRVDTFMRVTKEIEVSVGDAIRSCLYELFLDQKNRLLSWIGITNDVFEFVSAIEEFCTLTNLRCLWMR